MSKPCFLELFYLQTLPIIEWGKHVRVVLDIGCGVASFGGSLLDRDVITMSFAPKDEHEAQIQFALERGIPATLSVIGTQKLTFPDNAFDLIHCARCRIRWDADGKVSIFSFTPVSRSDLDPLPSSSITLSWTQMKMNRQLHP